MLWIFTSTWRSNNVLNNMCQVCVISMHVGFNISRVHLIKSPQFKSMLLRTPEVNVTLRPACIRTGHGSNQQTSSSKQDIVSHLRLLKVKLRSLPLQEEASVGAMAETEDSGPSDTAGSESGSDSTKDIEGPKVCLCCGQRAGTVDRDSPAGCEVLVEMKKCIKGNGNVECIMCMYICNIQPSNTERHW